MDKVKCPRCHKELAKVHPMFGVMPGEKCRAEDAKKRQTTTSPEFYTQSMQDRVKNQRDRHEKDILPPYTHEGKPNEEFARAFPEKAKELYGEYERVTGKVNPLK